MTQSILSPRFWQIRWLVLPALAAFANLSHFRLETQPSQRAWARGSAVRARRGAMGSKRPGSTRNYPLLSCADVEALVAHVLPRRDCDLYEVIRQLRVRDRKRQTSIDSASAKRE